jgi:predicted metal-dependent phosphoesterase TrpH
MLTVDFHCHTIYSKDGLTSLGTLLATCQRKNVDRVVITDHNTIQGALLARQMDPGRVIIGEEIMTSAGELLAIFVSEGVPRGLTPQDAIARLREQGAFISVSHPFDTLRSGHWEPADLLSILPQVDALETFNARCLWPGFNRRALAFARQHGLPGTAGSDAHTAFEIGRAALRLPDFQDPESLRTAIRQGQQQGGLSPAWVHFASTYAKGYKRLRRPHTPKSRLYHDDSQ